MRGGVRLPKHHASSSITDDLNTGRIIRPQDPHLYTNFATKHVQLSGLERLEAPSVVLQPAWRRPLGSLFVFSLSTSIRERAHIQSKMYPRRSRETAESRHAQHARPPPPYLYPEWARVLLLKLGTRGCGGELENRVRL